MATATASKTFYLYGTVGADFNDSDVVRAFDRVDADAIEVRINSGGGSVLQGLAIYDAMLRARARGITVTTYNDGAALSMGAILFQAGSPRVMSTNALLMLHLPFTDGGGNAPELRQQADVLDRVAARLTGIIVDRSKQPPSRVAAWFAQETWFDCGEAIASGLADLKATEITASVRSRAAAENALAKYRVPSRYAIASRAPIETALTDFCNSAKWARNARTYNGYCSLKDDAVRQAAKITKLPGVTNDDLKLVCDWLDEVKIAASCPRDDY